MTGIRRVVLDVLKPHEPELVEVARTVAAVEGVDGANATLVELDREVQNFKLTVEGEDVDFAAVRDAVEGMGASIHSVDQVACGEILVEESATPQD